MFSFPEYVFSYMLMVHTGRNADKKSLPCRQITTFLMITTSSLVPNHQMKGIRHLFYAISFKNLLFDVTGLLYKHIKSSPPSRPVHLTFSSKLRYISSHAKEDWRLRNLLRLTQYITMHSLITFENNYITVIREINQNPWIPNHMIDQLKQARPHHGTRNW